jgi:acetyl coenzyme A synthetase (ADP forming)-like protein
MARRLPAERLADHPATGTAREEVDVTVLNQEEWDVVLRDGATVHLRPYRETDARKVREFLGGLSPDTIYLRFFCVLPVDRVDLAALASSDPAARYTLLAEGGGRVLSLASYARSPDAASEAEVAFVIADSVQGRGLGTRLLEVLAEVARAHDITTFTAHVLGQNGRMLQVFRESGFHVDLTLESGEYLVTLDLRPAPRYEERAFERSRHAAAQSMRRLFEPGSVAVVGVGRSRGGIGSEIFHNLQAGFTGRVTPVNPSAGSIGGARAYPSVRQIPDDVDLAVIAVPCAQVPTVVEDCLDKGVRGLVVISAGFAEAGAEGRRAQDQVLARVREAGVRMIGPNCMGILNTDPAVHLNATFSPVYPPSGGVAMSTQSGALGLAILDYARQLQIGISSFASIGNKADVSSNDLIQYWAEDPRTTVMLLYVESFGNPRAFSRLARHVARAKPIVTIKAGRSTAGSRAAASHTGALATSEVLVDGLFRQAGIIRVATLAEMFDVAALLAHQPLPAGARLGIMTNAGGAGILAADAAESHGLAVPVLNPQTAGDLRGFLPATATVSNPMDMLASATPADYRRTLERLLADPGIDSVLVVYVPPLVTEPSAIASAIVAGAATARGKPVLATFMRAAGAPPELAGIPCFQFPEAGALALARATAYAQWRARPESAVSVPADFDKAAVRTILDRALQRGGGWLTVVEAQTLLETCRIPVASAALVSSEDEAVCRAQTLGCPVVLKAVGPELLHKTDVGGVRLDLRSSQEVVEAYRDLHARLGARMTGVLVQRMVPAGVELLVGTIEDDTFGPVMVCSLGGTLVELLGKPVARLLPLTHADIDELMREMPGSALLNGYRGSPPVDHGALRELLFRVSWLADAFPEILEIDLNPVRVFPAGLSVVDARVRIGRLRRSVPARRIAY